MITSNFVNYQALTYQDYQYPTAANVLGIIFALSGACFIPFVGLYKFLNARGNTLSEVNSNSFSLRTDFVSEVEASDNAVPEEAQPDRVHSDSDDPAALWHYALNIVV